MGGSYGKLGGTIMGQKKGEKSWKTIDSKWAVLLVESGAPSWDHEKGISQTKAFHKPTRGRLWSEKIYLGGNRRLSLCPTSVCPTSVHPTSVHPTVEKSNHVFSKAKTNASVQSF